MERSFFAESVSAVLEELATDPARGLTTEEANARLTRDGPNKLTEATPPPWWRNLLEQFNQLVIWILLGATIVSGILGNWLADFSSPPRSSSSVVSRSSQLSSLPYS